MKEIAVKAYKLWIEDMNDNFGEGESLYTYFNEREKRCLFLASELLDITTYDDGLSVEFGEMILETMIQIKNQTTFKYIEDKEKYKQFILSCNFLNGWLEWGTSIRGAWFNYYDSKISTPCSFYNVGYHNDTFKLSEDFTNWLIDFLDVK